MYPILVHLHSGFRWVVLITLILAIIQAAGKLSGNHSFTDKDKKMPLFAFISSHIQLLVGLILYFISPKVIFSAEAMKSALSRFFLVEHTTMMILAIIVISVGYIMAKKVAPEKKAFSRIFWAYLVGLILILASIPWPFLGYGTSWF
ncbi:MAG: cytochrome B [Bacteroidetes bacterium]|nr:cytochrome B [Bacteroidota bacterium]